ncbi:hypothetical protein [Lysobacter sp. FW306-1B-D06B]|uniref:hypothetical protein n=1 Tax=Lysobacter sp. FW306-1B-D06B TaxID=3140250 RepID=UPI00314007D2
MTKSSPLYVTDWSAFELPEQLHHLRAFLPGITHQYRSAPWLEDYESEVWNVLLHYHFTIDWRIPVGQDGELLTSPKHAELWTTLRSWLVLQTHRHAAGRVDYAPKAAYNSLRCVLVVIDYLLINAETSGLARFGLAGLSANYWHALVSTIIEEGNNDISVYRWPKLLTIWLRQKTESLTEEEVAATIAKQTDLSDCRNIDSRMTQLTDAEVVRARVWLWNAGLYKEQRQNADGRYTPNIAALARMLYPHTLAGHNGRFGVPQELLIGERSTRTRELPISKKVVTPERGWTRAYGTKFATTVSTLALLNREGFVAPEFDREELLATGRSVEARAAGRHRTLPCSVVFHGLNRAIEYVVMHGEDLVDSFVSLARRAHITGRSITTYADLNDITPHLTWGARQLGVTRWSVDRTSEGSVLTRDLPANDYFQQLRDNVGLWDCMQVLGGACKVVVGSLMARRLKELSDLEAGNCLDASGTRLIFHKGKSGHGTYREREARPIHPIGARCVKLLEGMQSLLVHAGALNAYSGLFRAPGIASGAGVLTSNKHASRYYENVDLFCDYAQMPCDHAGARYYIRQHQLRRWFAMMFFWGNSFGGVETLRWFLGHTDQQHLYYYITESTPGTVLLSVSAEWAVEAMRRSAPETDSLAAAVLEHFGATSFHVLEHDVVEAYVSGLLEERKVAIEPVFLDRGRACRIAVRLSSLS